MADAILQTNIPGVDVKRGKVRDIYDLGDKLIIAASDRISAFDRIMKTGIPNKGVLLTKISKFWFDFLGESVENHVLSVDVKDFPAPFCDHADQLEGRSMLIKKTKVLPVECIVRDYITGSGWKEYVKQGTVCGIKLPEGLKQCQRLPEPIFTPSTKAEQGAHDENISFEQSIDIVGEETANYLRQKSLEIFKTASDYALTKGIILADTKFEWGVIDDKIILIDEIFTPDSSRFWPADKYEAGRDQESYDKQFVRNYLEEISFDKSGDGVELPDEIVEKTLAKYIEAYEVLTGEKFVPVG